jgi:hypothetical protein
MFRYRYSCTGRNIPFSSEVGDIGVGFYIDIIRSLTKKPISGISSRNTGKLILEYLHV